ncbi:imidazole glycerol phosphate synthase subunit HisF [Sphingomonas sp. Leaf21]|uniref:imidazole glycerol phosphate synthase subunit HisF n=1 Tax=Sphingomonas sp. Leaf21 TaxID=2876550 RepID=UPI001E57BCFD|nr:imidazole glycerol phosphate synthase cyclase subunit [Sphingomonas sp. Leaf21]
MRLIARLDIKNEHVIKGIHLEGLRKVGDPNRLAKAYYEQGIDEIVFMDAVASLYDRNNLYHIIEAACRDVFVPIAVGGGLRTVEDVSKALGAGADKVVINTGAFRNIHMIEEIARKFGSQCLVGSIEAKKRDGTWKAYVDNGREPTDRDVISWANELERAGVGEILLTSVDQEGTGRGFDVDLIEQMNVAISRPLIVSGGYGKQAHLDALLSRTRPSAIAFASVLHYERATVDDLRQAARAYQE